MSGLEEDMSLLKTGVQVSQHCTIFPIEAEAKMDLQ